MLPVLRPLSSTPLLLAAPSGSLFHAPEVESLFGSIKFKPDKPDRFMARIADPGDGFSPFFLTETNTQVVFVKDPAQLGNEDLEAQWHNGLGLALFRSQPENVVGAIFIHGAMQNDWSAIGEGSWQALGGIMAFENLEFTEMLSFVLGKGMAMTPKWRFIDRSLGRAGHRTLTQLGGAKAIIAHDKNIHSAVRVAASVAAAIGIYISGSDQNMTPALCSLFARYAPKNFMGVSDHQIMRYAGEEPSPWTARGAYAGVEAARRKIFGNERAPLFLQGFGNTGQVMGRLAVGDKQPIAGVIDVNVDKLLQARALGIRNLYLDLTGNDESLRVKAIAAGITPVYGLAEALRRTPDTGILVPLANAHPINRHVARYLASSDSKIQAVVGTANSMTDLIDGSPDPIHWYLLQHGIFVPNDSSSNRMGANAAVSKAIQLDIEGLQNQVERIYEDVAEEYTKAFKRDIPPQLWRDQEAFTDWNKALDEGRAIGGRFELTDKFVPPSTDLG